MVRPIILNEKPISAVELKEELEEIKKRDKELSFRSQKTAEYLNQFITISPKQAEELKKKLQGLDITRLKEDITIKIIDLLPQTVDDLKTILQSYVANINKKDMEAIVNVVNGFVQEKKK